MECQTNASYAFVWQKVRQTGAVNNVSESYMISSMLA